jgi:hypothetical protein
VEGAVIVGVGEAPGDIVSGMRPSLPIEPGASCARACDQETESQKQ